MEIVEYKHPDMGWNSRIDRYQKLSRARELFPDVPDIQEKLRLYNATLPEEERIPIFVTTDTHGSKPLSVHEIVVMPMCPVCGNSELSIRQVPPNNEGVQSQLYCSNPNCDLVLNSEYTVVEWLTAIRRDYEDKRDAKQGEEGEQER